MAAPNYLDLQSISKTFGKVQAVSGVSLSVKKGEIYVLIGPNGAGKTTIVKMIAGLLEPTKGEVMIKDLSLKANPVGAKRYIGYIPDEPFAYTYLSGREFLEFTGDLHGLPRSETVRRITELARVYGMAGVLDGHFDDYSRGNKQKTVIMAALLHRPQLLIIDEPIVGLDAQSQRVTKQLLKDFVKHDGAVFVCTHTLNVAQEIADRIGVLHRGKLIHQGTMTQLRAKIKSNRADLETIYLKLTKS